MAEDTLFMISNTIDKATTVVRTPPRDLQRALKKNDAHPYLPSILQSRPGSDRTGLEVALP